MKKYFALGLGLFLPLNCLALESSDLAVELGEDMTVSTGEKFVISVLSAYDKTETCAQFFYDWRQTKGPITATPINSDVLAPEFQINTAGEYTFSLAVETRCDGVDNTRSETDKITITVEGISEEEIAEKNYEQDILPAEISLKADGESSWDLNFFLGNEEEKPDDEKIEFSLSSDDATLQENLGSLEALSDVTQNGLVALTYTAPEITDTNWAGGSVTILGKSAYGEASAKVNLTPRTENYAVNLRTVQTVDELPYLALGRETLGLVEVEMLGANETEIGVADVYLNGENAYHEEKIFFKNWTEAQKENYENLVSFYFIPTQEENDLTVILEIGGENLRVDKKIKAYDLDAAKIDLVALREGKWADLENVDLSENLAEQVGFLRERVPSEVEVTALENVPTVSAENVNSEQILVVPEGWSGDILAEKSVHADGTKYELAQAYLQEFLPENGSVISDNGALISGSESENLQDKGFELVDAETASIFAENAGVGLPYEVAWADLASLRNVVNFTDLNEGHWSYDYIRELIGRGVVGGYADLTVRPDQEITRAEFVKILLTCARISTNEVQKNVNFADMSAVDWSMPYVEQAVRYGLVGGYSDDTFRPNKSITRAEAVKILAEFLELELNENAESTFSDVENEAWYAPYVDAIREAGVVTGYADGTFKPNNPITRAEASKVIKVAIFGE